MNESVRNEIEIFISKWLLQNENSYLHNLLQYYSYTKLVQEVLTPILENSSCFDIDLDAMCSAIFECIHTNIKSSYTHIMDTAHELKNLIYQIEPNPQKSVLRFAEELTSLIEKLDDFSISTINTMRESEPLPVTLLPVTLSLLGVTSTKTIKPQSEEIKALVNTIKTQSSYLNKSIPAYIDKETYKNYCTALQPLLDKWNVHRKKHSLYTYTNISEIAEHTLEYDADVKNWYSKYFKYIIIDEFQDNNIKQRNLLYRLSATSDGIEGDIERKKYFFVGDPKQSIYSFRGANIEAFLSLKDNNKTLSMNTNYRSNPSLIDLFNDWFKKLFENESINDANLSYETQKSPSQASETNEEIFKDILSDEEYKHIDTMPKYPCLFDTIHKGENEDVDKEDIEAYNIVERIKTMKNNGIPLQDIAVLSRTKNIFPYIVRYLLEEDIPYHTENLTSSLKQDVGMDFYAWMSFVFHPQDKSSYAAILHSPLAHISKNTIYALLHIHRTVNENNAFQIPKELDAILETAISKEDEQALVSLRTKFEEARNILIEQVDVLTLLYHFWIECGYRYIILRNPKAHIFLEQFDILKTLITTHQKAGISACISALRAILEDNNKEDNLQTISHTDKVAVQLMSIHKSKGLEFPYVILAGMNHGFNNSKHTRNNGVVDNILYIDFPYSTQMPYLLKGEEEIQKTIYAEILERKNEKSERLRVLYVATTRAKKALILSGFIPYNSTNTYLKQMEKNEIVSFPTTDESTTEITDTYILIQKTVELLEQSKAYNNNKPDTHTQATIDYALHTLPVRDYIASYESKKLEISPSSSSHNDDKKTRSPQETLPNIPVDTILNTHKMHTVFGTYCHFLLRYYCKNEKIEANPIALESQLLPLSAKEKDIFMRDAEQLCKGFLLHPIWHKIWHPICQKNDPQDDQENAPPHNTTRNTTSEIFTEYPFLLWNEKHEVWVRGVIDLLIITDNQYIIIDYKVDKYKTPEQYKYQLASYRLAVQKIFRLAHQNNIESYLFYLREGALYEHKDYIEEDTIVSMIND